MEAGAVIEASPGGRRLARLVPWISLLWGVAAALWMERTPGRAVLVALGAMAGWVVLFGMLALRRMDPARHVGSRRALLRLARYSSGAISVSLIQQSLFFCIPFYFRAGDRSVGHVAFVALLSLTALATLWDPLIERVLLRPAGALFVQGLSTFAGLNAVLPILGLSNRAGLAVSAGFVALGLPLLAGLMPGGHRRRMIRAGAAALLLPLVLLVPAVRAAIPAAPLRLGGAAIGTRMEGRELADPASVLTQAPASLFCATAVVAPRGLHDDLLHVWRHDGQLVDRVAVEVRGGRDEGYRTWSEKKHLGPDPSGVWTCAVETASGQSLGATGIRIELPRT